ncbi:MAG: alpha/beta fold hydrolase [Erysipelotrichaceae bacterium]|nr:alpha/beta fold hydrolase [Erysipelotrichaceae bacterium]
MKYVFISLAFLAVTILAGYVITRFLTAKREYSRSRQALLIVAVSGLLMAVGTFGYFQIYYHADPSAGDYLVSHDGVRVSKVASGYFFDGPGTDKAIIFYPGGKVAEEAYAPLLFELAEQGADCFLVRMPLRMAVLGVSSADKIMAGYDYPQWYLMGHSLGGSAAALYAAKNPEKLAGLILLASYSTRKLPDDLRLLSIYGSEDGCLELKVYEEKKSLWPNDSQELVIAGGNHCQFGSYGFQKGDGQALISPQQQRSETVSAIASWLPEGDR